MQFISVLKHVIEYLTKFDTVSGELSAAHRSLPQLYAE